MQIKKAIMKIFNGSDWDEYHPKTSSDQVVHTKADGPATTVATILSELLSGGVNFMGIQHQSAKFVSDCLTQTTEAGVYKWYQAKNQPSGAGLIISWKFDSSSTYRLAMSYDQRVFFSRFENGKSWGNWKEFSFK